MIRSRHRTRITGRGEPGDERNRSQPTRLETRF